MRVLVSPSGSDQYNLPERFPNRTDEIINLRNGVSPDFGDTKRNTWSELTERLPAGWTPEAFVYWSLEYNAVPLGTEDADCFTVGVVGDWNLGGQALQQVGGAFDLLIADKRGCEHLRALGFERVRYAPLWSYDTSVHRKLPGVERDLDIVMVGSFNHDVQQERARWLGRVAKLSKKYRVCVTAGVFGEEYTHLLNRAKIVFNRSIRGEINMRAYEAAACGAVMFYERENPSIGEMFADREHCVLYSDDDLEDLLDYYLSHDAERERIAEAGHRRVQSHTTAHNFEQILNIIEEERAKGYVPDRRPFRSLPAVERLFRIGSQSLVCPGNRNFAALDVTFQQAQELEPTRPDLANARACLLGEFALALTDDTLRSAAFAKAIEWVNRALLLDSNFAVARLNLAQLLLHCGNEAAAEEPLRLAAEALRSDFLRMEHVSGPYFPRHADGYRVEIERAWGQHPQGTIEWAQALRAVLLWKTQVLRAELSLGQGDNDKAAALAEEATRLLPEQPAAYTLQGQALLRSARHEEAARALRHAIDLSPLKADLWPEYVSALFAKSDRQTGIAFLEETLALIDGCPKMSDLRPEIEALAAEFHSLLAPTINLTPIPKEPIVPLSTPVEHSDKPGILWGGSFFVHHSLALVNRELTLALLETEQYSIGIQHYEAPTFVPHEDGRFAPLAASLSALPEAPFATIRHQWPPDFTRPATPKFVLIQPWEFGSIPSEWVKQIDRTVDEVWAYTNFVREEYIASGVPGEKVFVVPLGVNTDRFHPGVAPLTLPTQKKFKFLFVGGTIARKGIDVLLDAYSRAFTAQDDVSLVIKDFGADSFYAGQGAGALIAALQQKPNAPEIVYLNKTLEEADMPSLYAACDALVHPYRGEGYGLPIAEAMACGKPTVITGFGAALDFANSKNAYLIPAQRVHLAEKRIGDLETVDYPWWAEPDRDALAATLRNLYENPEAARTIGAQAAKDIADKHTWAHAAQAVVARLDAIRQTVNVCPPVVTTSSQVFDRESEKQEILTLTREGRWTEAVSRADVFLAQQPAGQTDWDVLNALAVALFRSGQKERAFTLLRQGVQSAPNSRDFHHNLAFLLLAEGQGTEALEHAVAAFVDSLESPEIRRTVERAREATKQEARKLRKRLEAQGNSAAKKDERLRALTALIAKADALLATRPATSDERPKLVVPKGPRLSLVMIVKNEEKYLRGCLESVQGAVDEIVIVDTGSTDATITIAEEFGAKVIHHAWTDDFSAARNVSLDHATGDWAFWLDADERLGKGEGRLLRYLVEEAEPNVGGYLVNIRNFMQSTEDPEEAESCWHRAARLFRLLPDVRFTGRIHEQNMKAMQAAGYVCAYSKLSIDHLGYTGEVMEERNKHERFIRMLTREVEENLHDEYRAFHLFNLGNAYFTSGDYNAAIEWLGKGAEVVNPGEEYAGILFVELATSLYATKQYARSLSACEQAEQLGIRHPGLHFAKGHTNLHRANYKQAETDFRTAISEGAKGQEGLFVHTGDTGAYTYKAWYGLAMAVTGQDRFAEALDFCRTALEGKADFIDARYLLANTLQRLKRLTEARRELETILAECPSHPVAGQDLSDVLMEIRDYPAALPVLRRLNSQQPHQVTTLIRLATCAENCGLPEEARDACLTARRLQPESAEIRVNLGRAYAALGQDNEAVDCYTEAIKLNPRYANAYFNAGDLLYKLGYYAQAAETLQSGLQLEPGNAEGFFVLGNCLFQTRDYAAACLCYEAALTRDPAHKAAGNNLSLAREEAAAFQPTA